VRNMSFRMTTEQVKNQTKTVTRRVGWAFLKPGDLVQPIVKGQGLKKGETVQKIGGPIRIEKVTGEWMSDFLRRPDAQEECRREGFSRMTPQEFYRMFRRSHADPGADDLRVTRIEFSYVAANLNGGCGTRMTGEPTHDHAR
jgi:hypothetical protein